MQIQPPPPSSRRAQAHEHELKCLLSPLDTSVPPQLARPAPGCRAAPGSCSISSAPELPPCPAALHRAGWNGSRRRRTSSRPAPESPSSSPAGPPRRRARRHNPDRPKDLQAGALFSSSLSPVIPFLSLISLLSLCLNELQETTMAVPVVRASPRPVGARGTGSAPNLAGSPVPDLVHLGAHLLRLASLEMPRIADSKPRLRTCNCVPSHGNRAGHLWSVSLSARANRAAAAERESALQPMVLTNYSQANIGARDDVHTRAAARPWSRHRHSNFSDEITDEKRPGERGVIKIGPWGGSGGKAFYMRRGRGVSAPRVRSVTLQYTDAIHSFYQSSDEAVVKQTLQRAEGGGQGRARLTINFASDEQLVAVEGTYGHCSYVPAVVVTSLTFRTDKGRTYGPYGKEIGTSFSIPAANGCIVGFWGRSGWLLDAIGVYIRPCQAHKAA